jgi:diaminopimelate epimerase
VTNTSCSLHRLEGDGNRFLLVDHLGGDSVGDPVEHARRVCANGALEADGVLHLDRDGKGRLTMVLYNRDGSRPETCGNGLRCLAWHAVAAGYEECGDFEISTDAGLTRAQVQRTSDGELQVRVSLGPIRIVEPVSLEGPVPEATWVDCGNPHLVLFGEDLAVEEWGPRLSCDPRFPSGINVEFVQVGASSLQTRVWERGVGETAACGSGACAVARVAVERGLATWPVSVALPGGVLTITPCEGSEGLWLQGEVCAVEDGPL